MRKTRAMRGGAGEWGGVLGRQEGRGGGGF